MLVCLHGFLYFWEQNFARLSGYGYFLDFRGSNGVRGKRGITNAESLCHAKLTKKP